MTRSRYYYCKKTKQIVEGNPPYEATIFGEAPQFIRPSMPPTYHEAAQRVIDDRNEWNLADKQHGTITFGSAEQAKPRVSEHEERKKKKAELRKASKAALDTYRANPKEVAARVQRQREIQTEVARKSGLNEVLRKAGVKYEQ